MAKKKQGDPKDSKPVESTEPVAAKDSVDATNANPENAIDNMGNKPKRRLRAPAPSIREQSEKAAASNNRDKPKRSVLSIIASLPIVIVMWPITMLFKYVLIPPFRFLNRFKVFRAIGLVLFPPYFRNSFRELKLVTWPNTRETYDLVVAVLIFSIVFGLVVAGIDYVLDKAFRELILNK